MKQPFGYILLLFVLPVLFSGCATEKGSSFFQNPFAMGKRSDRVPGVPVPSERIRDINQLAAAAGRVSPERELEYSQSLVQIVKNDQDSNCRAKAVKALGKFNNPSAAEGIQFAMTDSVKYVRINACNAWLDRKNPKEGTQALNELVLHEEDPDVLLAAIHALETCGESSSQQALGQMLETSNPALQIAAMNTLGKLNSNPCRDLQQWRQYCRGEIQIQQMSKPEFSVADKFNIWK